MHFKNWVTAHKRHLTLALILVFSAILRYWAIRYDWRYRPDEEQIVSISSSLIARLNPGNFVYPTFYKYINLLIYVGGLLPKILTGYFSDLGHLALYIQQDPAFYFNLDRYIAATFGLATVGLLYVMARERFNERVALISAAFLGLCYLHIRNSHFGTTDVPLTFFVVLCEIFVGRILVSPKWNNYIWAGIIGGLATSTKYPGILLCLPILVAQLQCRRSIFDRKFIVASILFGFFFLAGSPYIALTYHRFAQDFSNTYRTHHMGAPVDLGRGWTYYLKHTLPGGLGWPLYLSSVLGSFLLLRTKFRSLALLVTFPLAYYYFIGKGVCVYTRYCVPLLPYLCILGAFGATWLADRGALYFSRINKIYVEVAVVILLILPSARTSVLFDHFLTLTDTRTDAVVWINTQVPAGKRFYITGASCGKVNLPGNYVNVGDETFADRKSPMPDYVILQNSYFKFLQIIDGDRVHWILDHYYTKQTDFTSSIPGDHHDTFDDQDAFFTPYTGFTSMSRPGPDLAVYERRADAPLFPEK